MKLTKRARSWSARSASSIRQEQALQGRTEDYLRLKKKTEENLSDLDAEKGRYSRDVADGRPEAEKRLGETLAKIDDQKRKLAAYTEAATAAKSELEKFRLAVSKAATERRENQNALARLARQRLEIERKLEAGLNGFRQSLQECLELTARMQSLGGNIELDCDWGHSRYGAVLESLPANILPEAERWLAGFFGTRKGMKPYVVIAEELSVAENLAHCGIYHFGETVYLREEQAQEFLREDRWEFKKTAFGRERELLPPDIMPAKKFEELKAEAAKEGSDVHALLAERHRERVREALLPKRGEPLFTESHPPMGLSQVSS